MDKQYYNYLAKCKLKATEYRIILILLVKPCTSSQLVKELGCMKNNTDRYIRNLKSHGLIEIDYIEGANKFYKPVTDIKKLMAIMPGQMKIE
ncbi:helix-turn-helix domain-containing protein [Niameybacter massiliensis]|uniref:hypothetical protein n=1 Tax=Niameybacter massiliensis TaxID=1658108 RepID=UPI0006B56D32|nr:hypothetical protein [Niameybacter massiliensis]